MAITTNGAAGAQTITQLTVGTSADLASIISDESGTGVLAFTNTPTLTTPVLSGTTTTASGNLAVQPATYILEVKGGASTEGAIQLNCAVNSHGQKVKSQPHAQAASNTLLLPGGSTIGNSDAVLVSDTGTQTLTNKTLTSPALTTPTISTYTTNGDIVYGTGSGAIVRLGAGSAGQVLTIAGGVPTYATPSAGTTANDQAFAFAVQVFA